MVTTKNPVSQSQWTNQQERLGFYVLTSESCIQHSENFWKQKSPYICMRDHKKKHQGRQLLWLSKLRVKFQKDNLQPTHNSMAIMSSQTRPEFD